MAHGGMRQMSRLEIARLTDVIFSLRCTMELEGARVKPRHDPIRVIIADDRERVRFGLRTLLGSQPQIEVAGEVQQAADLIEAVQSSRSDLVVLDWELLQSDDGQIVERLRQRCPQLRMVVLSGQPEVKAAALQAGADAFVDKTESPAALLSAIERCFGGEQPAVARTQSQRSE